MFWDNIAWVYDIFADGINRKANRKLCKVVAGLISPTDDVLECACGTGLLSGVIAKRCKSLTATDFSAKMLTRARKKYGQYPHVQFEQADILHLPYPDARFDAVVAANVITCWIIRIRRCGSLTACASRVESSLSPPT